jgi:hypothetical protein
VFENVDSEPPIAPGYFPPGDYVGQGTGPTLTRYSSGSIEARFMTDFCFFCPWIFNVDTTCISNAHLILLFYLSFLFAKLLNQNN